jgi:hypothetical protein
MAVSKKRKYKKRKSSAPVRSTRQTVSEKPVTDSPKPPSYNIAGKSKTKAMFFRVGAVVLALLIIITFAVFLPF